MPTVKSLVSASLDCLCTRCGRLRLNIFCQLAVIRWLFVLNQRTEKPILFTFSEQNLGTEQYLPSTK